MYFPYLYPVITIAFIAQFRDDNVDRSSSKRQICKPSNGAFLLIYRTLLPKDPKMWAVLAKIMDFSCAKILCHESETFSLLALVNGNRSCRGVVAGEACSSQVNLQRSC